MPKPVSLQTLARVLENDEQLGSWNARHKQELALTNAVRRHLPRPLAERIRVADVRDGVLDLVTAAGAIAATVRQRTPDLLAALRREGYDCTEIRVRVQVRTGKPAERKAAARQWDSASAAPLFDLAARLPEGPLKAALSRWSRRARGR